MLTPSRLALLFALVFVVAAVSCTEDSTAILRARLDHAASQPGEVLIANSSCTACHSATAATVRRLGTAPAPVLLGPTGVGSRLSLPAIATRLSAHGDDHGLRMPDLFGAVPDRDAAQHAVAQFLASQGGPLPAATALASDALADAGKRLWASVGCTACHETEASLGDLASAWTRSSLSAFLADPLASHPAGRMPNLNLSALEAKGLATFLLRNQTTDAAGRDHLDSAMGLNLEFFSGPFTGGGPTENDTNPDFTTTVAVPSVGPGKGKNHFGLRLTSELEIPATGRWSFWLLSDDGSHLYIDGALLIDHGGVHGVSDKRGSVKLTEGPHAITLTMFEASGGEELALSWSGPGIPRERVPASAFSIHTLSMQPTWDNDPLDPALVHEGEQLFLTLGCTACHEPSLPRPHLLATATPFASLSPNRGCVAEHPAVTLPHFGFTAEERRAIDRVLAQPNDLEEPLPAPQAVANTMMRLGCINCHRRDGVGSPSTDTNARFVSDDHAELGDEGRLPPDLTGVGNKLRLSALREVLSKGTKIRPYMKTRMPTFGTANIDDLVVHLAASDAKNADAVEPPFTETAALAGHRLSGLDGVACIQCHTAGGHPSLGVPAIDLTLMHHRLRPGWFMKHLLDPQRANPGTRMTSFWGEDGSDRIFPAIEGGNPERQVAAIWSYLSLGDSMLLPAGIVPDKGTYTLTPTTEPIVFGANMQGASARTLAVGLPESAHYAWDMEHGRLAMCWHGAFMDAEGAWHGRNASVQSPAGTNILHLPAGHAVELLDNRTRAWPLPKDRSPDGTRHDPWRTRGVERDSARRPMFLLEQDGVRVREHIVPRLARGGTHLNRIFTVYSDEARGDLYMRAAVAPSIEPGAGEGRHRRWRIGVDRSIEIRGADSFVREDQHGVKELLVKVPLSFSGNDDAEFEGTFEVELSW